MDIKQLNTKKTPLVTIDRSLESYKNKPLFQQKVEKANNILKNVGLPKQKKKRSA